MEESDVKLKTARTLKWNTIDKFASQVLYAVTGVVLANVLSKEDFGLVGAILVFQSFASLFVDSGFSSALIQKKNPTERDYSTIFWFNLAMSVGIYVILWFCAPLIARMFGDERLISLSRAMFVSFILSALAIVQTNRLMKQMTVARVAVGNTIGLVGCCRYLACHCRLRCLGDCVADADTYRRKVAFPVADYRLGAPPPAQHGVPALDVFRGAWRDVELVSQHGFPQCLFVCHRCLL